MNATTGQGWRATVWGGGLWVGWEGKGIWATETNTYKTHKHSCLSEFVHKFSNLSCSLPGQEKGPERRGRAWEWVWSGEATKIRKIYASFELVLSRIDSQFQLQLLTAFSFTIHTSNRLYIYYNSDIMFCCDSTAIIIAITFALCKTSGGNRRCFTSPRA